MIRAQDVMTREVVSVSADTAIEDLARLLVEKKVSAVPVVEADGRLVGIISEGDLLQRDKPLHIPTVISIFDWVLYLETSKKFEMEVKKITARKVSELCTRNVVTCSPETPLTEVAQLMVNRHVHLIPVVDEGKRVVGVVTRLDVVRSLEL
ncbi:MAG: CBS domain-containing protein [Desulfuromonadaceae bacterium]|nr:CBS domain-containing protein [Desulfuromonadaceae bacterium]